MTNEVSEKEESDDPLEKTEQQEMFDRHGGQRYG